MQTNYFQDYIICQRHKASGSKKSELLILIGLLDSEVSITSGQHYWDENQEACCIEVADPDILFSYNFCKLYLCPEFHKYLKLQFPYLELASQYSEEKPDMLSFYLESLNIKHILFSYLQKQICFILLSLQSSL